VTALGQPTAHCFLLGVVFAYHPQFE